MPFARIMPAQVPKISADQAALSMPTPFRSFIGAMKHLFTRRDVKKGARAQVPAGTRYYAIGDIHGRLDLLEALRAAIEADNARLPASETRIILLGDLIDRGPHSAQVLKLAREWQAAAEVQILAGNHEDMFLRSFEQVEALRHFLRHGGRETLLSFDISRAQFDALTTEQLFEALPGIVPLETREFVAGFADKIEAGDYLFVHAGIDPNVPIAAQKSSDCMWIREEFLSHPGPFEKVIVHGHTIFPDIEEKRGRIGIDTGAFRSGVLTALVLEGGTRRFLQAVDDDGQITVRHRANA